MRSRLYLLLAVAVWMSACGDAPEHNKHGAYTAPKSQRPEGQRPPPPAAPPLPGACGTETFDGLSLLSCDRASTDADLVKLGELAEAGRLDRLHRIDLSHSGVTDAGLKHLAKVRGLDSIDLGMTRVTDAGLHDLAKLQGLRQLAVYPYFYTASRTERLIFGSAAKHTPPAVQITDAALDALLEMQRLENLDLSYTDLTDTGVARLVGLANLRTLRLVSVDVTIRGIEPLCTLEHLYRLDLRFTGVGDEIVDLLISCERLYRVDLVETQVSAEGAKRLRAARPDMLVKWRAN